MDKNAIWKWLILLGLLSVSFMLSTPPKKKIRLGLDLQGGISLTVKIDEERLREDIKREAGDIAAEDLDAKVKERLTDAHSRALVVLRNRIDNLGIEEPIIFPGEDNRIVIQLPGADEKTRLSAEAAIRKLAYLEFRLVHERNDQLISDLFARGLAPEGYVTARDGDMFLYEQDPNFPGSKRDAEYRRRLGRFEARDAEYEFMLAETERDNRTYYRPYYVKRRPEMTGKYVSGARAAMGGMKGPVVSLSFNAKGKRLFADITGAYRPRGERNPSDRGRQLAIVLDGTLHSAPEIQNAIYGNAEISGNFDMPEAKKLAGILRAGSLPAPVKIVEKMFVAPSLGRDSVNSGLRAVILGGAGVLVFMLLYYLLSGVVADIALVVTMCLLPLGMTVAAGFLGVLARAPMSGGPVRLPVLTLPGIAGILLTIGMSVDANVLIFERIREEMSRGKRLWPAITAGYDRAFITITDANVTTLLTGAILFIFGSGPIRGFAVTLCGGIMVSMYASLVVTKMIFAALASRTTLTSLKMLRIVGDTSIDFVAKRKAAITLSMLVIAGSWAAMSYNMANHPGRIFSVDFTGGSAVRFAFAQKAPLETLKKALDDAGIKEAHLQYQKDIETRADKLLLVRTGTGTVGGVPVAEAVTKCLMETVPDAGFEVALEEEIGPQIGKELKRRAVLSVLLALVVIIVYLSWRFELGFAVGAIVALAHDVLATVGIFTLAGCQISLPIVAALLTIVGYSVNDTIVIFDRIRENLKSMRQPTFSEICNISINQTLSRTLLTSLTTMITVVLLLLFGGGQIFDFAFALFIGVIVGTYSSVFIATPVALWWHRNRKPGFAA